MTGTLGAVIAAGVSVSAGALFWYKFVLPFGRVLKNSEELERGDSIAIREGGASIGASGSETAMTHSLVKLSKALGTVPGSAADSQREVEQTVLPAA